MAEHESPNCITCEMNRAEEESVIILDYLLTAIARISLFGSNTASKTVERLKYAEHKAQDEEDKIVLAALIAYTQTFIEEATEQKQENK